MEQAEVILATSVKTFHAGRYWYVNRKIQATSRWRTDARHVWTHAPAWRPAVRPAVRPAGAGVCQLTPEGAGTDRHYFRFFWDGEPL